MVANDEAFVMLLTERRSAMPEPSVRTYQVLGVGLRSGSLYPGSEDDAGAFRHAGLFPRLYAAGCQVIDAGAVGIPSYLPHHAVPSTRNSPGPRIVRDSVGERVCPLLHQPRHIPLLIGCDCSIVVQGCA